LWRKWGLGAFFGLVFGLGLSAARHLPWIPGVLASGLLVGLLGLLIDFRRVRATTRRRNVPTISQDSDPDVAS